MRPTEGKPGALADGLKYCEMDSKHSTRCWNLDLPLIVVVVVVGAAGNMTCDVKVCSMFCSSWFGGCT